MVDFKHKKRFSVYVYIIVALLIICAGIFNLYFSVPDKFEKNKQVAINKCIDLCYQERLKGTMLEDGPCLSNKIVVGWVCDVAHNPRFNLIDDKKQNQCSEYGSKNTKHFVEVTKECKLIRAV